MRERIVALGDDANNGRVINPIIVDGQVTGGIVHGIGNAFLERMRFDGSG